MGLLGTLSLSLSLYLSLCVSLSLYLSWMLLTHCQDHILTENIWFVWSRTSYSGDKWRCYRCGTTNERTNKQTLKIELLSQWKLEAESRKYGVARFSRKWESFKNNGWLPTGSSHSKDCRATVLRRPTFQSPLKTPAHSKLPHLV